MFTFAVSFSAFLLAQSFNEGNSSIEKTSQADTITDPKVIGGATALCEQKSCIETLLKKIDGFDPNSYMIMYQINKTDFVLEQRPSRFKEILSTYKPKAITIMDNNITISGIKYDAKHLVTLW